MSDDSTIDSAIGLMQRAEFLKAVRDAQLGSSKDLPRGCLLILHFPGLLDIAQQEGMSVLDATLQSLLGIIEARLRRRDTLGRIGEQSLCVLLRQCEEKNAIAIADQYETLLNDVAYDERLQSALVGFHYRVVSLDSERRRSLSGEESGANTRALSEASILLATIRSFSQADEPVPGELVSLVGSNAEPPSSIAAMPTQARPGVSNASVDATQLTAQSWRLKPGHLLSQQLLATCYRVQSVGFARSDQALPDNPMFHAALNALALNVKLARPIIESLLILPVSVSQLTHEASFWLKERCRSQRIAPSDICLLLSVDTVSEDLRTSMPVLRRLNRQGVRLMLEGVTSAPQFTALQNLAGFDYVWISAKVLQSSVLELRARQELEALIAAAHAQHREVCAAGIDSQVLLEHARALRIDIGFGRVCGRSLPFPEVEVVDLDPNSPEGL